MKTRPLAPRTEAQYTRVLKRAFGDVDLRELERPPENLSAWSESERRVLRHAVRDWFARRDAEDAGVQFAAYIPVQYTIRRISPKPTHEDANKFEAQAAKYPKKKYRPLFAVLLRLGLRAEELLTLPRERVIEAVETGTLRFVRKGGVEKELPCKHVQSEFRTLLGLKRALPRPLTQQTAVINAGGPFDWDVVGQVIADASFPTQYNLLARAVKVNAAHAGLDVKLWSVHKLRHMFATRMHSDGAPMRVVQEALGHASITTTQRYVNVERGDIAKYVRGRPE